MKSNIFKSTIIEMKELNNLFIEMTAKSCNQHCKHCYIEFPQYKKVQDFISIDVIKQALNDTTQDKVECIYLTGAEPMTHPDFNTILRLCLKRSNVCICTNGSYINEKKARFLKKVEDESNNEIIFKISMNHFEEVKNDDVRYRGAYRQAVFAIKHLLKYNFNPIISIANYYSISNDDLWNGFALLFSKNNFDMDKSNLQIVPWYDDQVSCGGEGNLGVNSDNLDCENGRITEKQSQ